MAWLFKWINTWRASSSATSSVDSPFERPEQINDHVYQLHKPAGRPSIEIVFFHGPQLEGSGREAYLSTWLSAEGSELWLTWILKEFENARILLVSYDASAQRNDEQGIMDTYQTCENLMHCLTEEKANVGGDGCPVILVGHSIGCLVMKELCLKLDSTINKGPPHNSKESVQNLLQNVKGLFYFACPHLGSRLADKSADFPKSPLFEGLRPFNKEAQRSNEDFRQLRQNHGWKVFGIGEGRPTTSGQFKGYHVPEASARYDVDDFYTCDYADHFNVCRPKCTSSSTFVHLSRLLGDVLKEDQDRRSPKTFPSRGIYGLEGHVKDITEKLDKGVKRLGIIGMGGVGKTTLAEVVYQTISGSFEYACFLRNVKKSMAIKDNLQYLRKKIIRNLYYKGRKVKDTFNWETLKQKKVLILLDDVEREPQVQVMLESDGFLDGSCVIVTSREKRFLQRENFECHVVDKLGKEDSRKLFCFNAFGNEEVDESVDKWRIEQFLKRCEGLPLALRIVGKYLHLQEQGVWDDALQKLKHAESLEGKEDDGLWSILRVCYKSLAKVEQEMFLDVATCFHDQDLEKVKQAWSLCGWGSPFSGLKNLEDKGLVTIEENIIIEENNQPRKERTIRMHEVLRDLGRSIACPNTESVGMHTRLCYDLSNPSPTTELFNEGKAQVKVLIIHRCEDISIQSLHGLEELRILWLEDVSLQGPLNLLPAKLAYMKIADSRLCIQPEGSHSRATDASEEREKKRQRVGQHSALKHVEINACELLEGSLDTLGQFHALEHLEINLLSNWTAIPDSLGQLQALKHLVLLCGCLKAPPGLLRKLRSLRHIEITSCQDWEDLMNSVAELEALKKIAIHNCIDHSYRVIDQLRLLESLAQRRLLQGVGQIDLPMFYEDSVLEIIGWNSELLPSKFVGAGPVRRLLIKDCQNLKALPNTLGNLQVLEDLKIVNCRNLEALPNTIGELKALQSLSITSCRSLKSLPNAVGKLQALTYLLISCGSVKVPLNTHQLDKALRLEITWCRFRHWKDFLETLGQLQALQTLVVRSCIHHRRSHSLRRQLDLLEFLTRRGLLQGPGQVDIPMFHREGLEIERLKFEHIHSQIFRLGHVWSLLIQNCRNLEVIPDALGNLAALKYLIIDGCRSLKALPDSLGELHALQELVVHECKGLRALPETLTNLQALEVLKIGYCGQLKSLPEAIGKLEALKILHIEYCDTLKELPNSLGELHALQELVVHECKGLRALPETLTNLQALNVLKIKDCAHLKSLPEAIGKFGALKILHIKYCSTLEELPNSLGELHALQELDVHLCHGLRALPETLTNLQALNVLKIKHCAHLKSLPECIGKLGALKELYIEDCNTLEELPDSLGELHTLQELVVDGYGCQGLRALPETLTNLQALNVLKIKYCAHLKSLPEAIGKFGALKELYIEDCNTLEELPNSLGELPALWRFKISSCWCLKSLPESLGKLEVLKELHIRDCNSLEAPPHLLRELQARKVLSFERCDGLSSCLAARITVDLLSRLGKHSFDVEELRLL